MWRSRTSATQSLVRKVCLNPTEDIMIKIGTSVSYDGVKGIVDRTSIKTGVKLYRVNNRWFAKDALTLLG